MNETLQSCPMLKHCLLIGTSVAYRPLPLPVNIQAPVVRRVDSATHWINHHPVDKSIGFNSAYPLDSAIHLLSNRDLIFLLLSPVPRCNCVIEIIPLVMSWCILYLPKKNLLSLIVIFMSYNLTRLSCHSSLRNSSYYRVIENILVHEVLLERWWRTDQFCMHGAKYSSVRKAARAGSVVFLGNLLLFLLDVSNVWRERTYKPGKWTSLRKSIIVFCTQ